MLVDILAYLIWIIVVFLSIGLTIRVLQMDRPREIQVPIQIDKNAQNRLG